MQMYDETGAKEKSESKPHVSPGVKQASKVTFFSLKLYFGEAIIQIEELSEAFACTLYSCVIS